MRRLAAAVVLSVAAFHCALSVSLEGSEKVEKVAPYDSLTELLKIDQEEFEAAQKEDSDDQKNKPVQFEAAQKEDVIIVNVTVDDGEDDRYLEAVKDGCVEGPQGPAGVNTGGDGNSEAAATRDETQSRSSEEAEAHSEAVTESAKSSSEEAAAQDSSKERDEQE